MLVIVDFLSNLLKRFSFIDYKHLHYKTKPKDKTRRKLKAFEKGVYMRIYKRDFYVFRFCAFSAVSIDKTLCVGVMHKARTEDPRNEKE